MTINLETETKPQLDDMIVAMHWANEIMNPCSFEHEGKRYDIRSVYLREVIKNVIPRLTNSLAREMLSGVVEIYS